MTHIYSIGKILGIKDKNIKLEDKITEEENNKRTSTVFFGTLTYTPKGCMNCGAVNHSHADIVKMERRRVRLSWDSIILN